MAKKEKSSAFGIESVHGGSSKGLIFVFLTLVVSEVRTICSAGVALIGKCRWDKRPIFDGQSASSLLGTSAWDGTLTERSSLSSLENSSSRSMHVTLPLHPLRPRHSRLCATPCAARSTYSESVQMAIFKPGTILVAVLLHTIVLCY